MFSFALFCVFLTSVSCIDKKEHLNSYWVYDNTSSSGPANWNGTCRTGQQQSPIDIQPQNVTVKPGSTLVFSPEFYNRNTYIMVNTGRYVAIVQPEPLDEIYGNINNPSIRIRGDAWEQPYYFQAVTFHWPSEHFIEGRQYAMEMKIMWKPTPNGVRSKHFNNLFVLFEISNTDSDLIAPIVNQLLNIREPHARVSIPDGLNISTLLPNRWDLFRYMGSQLQPPCHEGAMQSVFAQTLIISQKQMDEFKKLLDDDRNEIHSCNRPIQPTYTSQRNDVSWMPIDKQKMMTSSFEGNLHHGTDFPVEHGFHQTFA